MRRGEDDGYTLEDLRAVTGPTVAVLLDAEGPQRWSRLATELAQHGATISEAVDDWGWRAATLQHLLAQHCKGGEHGFFTEADRVRLDTPEGCGPLTGNPELVAVGAASLMTTPRAAFESMRRACAAHRSVPLKTRGGKTLRVPCTQAPEPPTRYAVLDAPALAR